MSSKRVLLVLGTVLLVGCNTSTYNSYYEAMEACKEWRNKDKPVVLTPTKRLGVRSCREEVRTNQFLGFESVRGEGLRNGQSWIDEEVKRNFRF